MPGRHWDTTVTEAIKIPTKEKTNIKISVISDHNSRDIHRLNVKQKLKLHLTTQILHPGEKAVWFSTYSHPDTFKTMTARDSFSFPTWTRRSRDNPPPHTDADGKGVFLYRSLSQALHYKYHIQEPQSQQRTPMYWQCSSSVSISDTYCRTEFLQ